MSADGDSALPWTSTLRISPPTFPKGAWMDPRTYSSRFGPSAPRPAPTP
jgi:hypothetical protein